MKIFGIVVLSILLLIFLSAFGLAFTVDQIALNPGFVTGVIKDIDFSQVTRDAIQYQQIHYPDETLSQETVDVIVETVDDIEPVIKENVIITVRGVYDYVLGKENVPDFKETLGNSIMNTRFIESILDRIDLSRIADEIIREQTTSGVDDMDAFEEAFLAALDELEPTLEKGIVASSDPVFKYLLGETGTINLRDILRQNIFSKEFIIEMIGAMDIKSATRDFIGEQLDVTLPQNITLNSNEIDQIIAVVEPAIKAGMISAADPIADYLAGMRSSFNITIRWDTVANDVKLIVKQAFMRQLPSDLATATPAQIDQAYETYWVSAQSYIPASFNLDATVLGENVSQDINDALSSAQNGLVNGRDGINDASINLTEARDEAQPYINLVRSIYWVIILLILLAVGGLILIHRAVREASLNLGIVFLVYGGLGLISVLIIRNIIGGVKFIQRFVEGDMPEYVFNIISPIMQRLTQPLFIVTLVCAIIGIVLLVLYFLYPRMKTGTETSQPPSQSN